MTSSAAAVGGGLPLAPARATMSVLSYSDVSDGELITMVGSGDRNAFDALYRRYARPVFGLALRRLGDRGRAEDAVQETFASVWRAAGSYKPERGPGAPWLYAVARNAIVDNGRMRRETPVDPPDEVAGGDSPADQAEAGWVTWRVHRALGQLPERERQVIELAYWGGRSQSEIAELLGIPLGTVKTRTRTGLSRLADVLEDVL
jgi:RNA polymerase sigma-70 factor, ECF subfamily